MTNSGDTAVEWTMETNSDAYESTVPSGTLPPDTSTSVKIIFERNGLSEGDYIGTLTINGDEATYDIDLTGSVENRPTLITFMLTPPQ